MKKAICFIVLVTANIRTFGSDTVTASVNDITSKEHIITFTGKVDFAEQFNGTARAYKEHGTLVARNATKKGIVALIATIKSAGFRGPESVMLYKHDYFFKPNGLEPNGTVNIAVDQDTTQDPYNVTTITSYVTSEVKFVQFDDGSMWGDTDMGSMLLKERADAEAYLNRLSTTYTERGEAAFVSALQDIPKPPTSAYFLSKHLQMLFSQEGTRATIDSINSRLSIAAERRASGKF